MRKFFIFIMIGVLFCMIGCEEVQNNAEAGDSYPESGQDEILEESEKAVDIPYNVGVNVNIHASNSGQWFTIAKSLKELNAIYNSDDNPNGINYIEKYNDTFFQENAVIVVFESLSSGAFTIRIDSLVKKQGELSIGMTKVEPEGFVTADMAYWRIILEVKKSDIDDVVKLRLVEEKQ